MNEGSHRVTGCASSSAAPVAKLHSLGIKDVPELVAGRYRLERLLGAGGMGAVYRARDLLHEQYGDPQPCIALKMLRKEFSESCDASALLYSEFALTRYLRHPNVLRPYTFDVDAGCGQAFITLELMHGLTLDQLLCERPLGLPWHELRAIAVPLLDALAYAHGRGVLHGDMKPSNVMLNGADVRLFDFGLGLAEEGPLKDLPGLNRERLKAWTPGYAAPELLEGWPLSRKADVYGVACLLYELASGKHPFRRLPSIQARDAGLERELKPPRDLPRRCWRALRSALAFDPRQRSIEAQQLRDALASISSWW
ncbi:serine/threonine-protein kinase [Pseudomonas citri]|uniref:serine/threonine-protein kinase n=1 Tax=Pseudomonas citri TaxID=2978349 RepID=UPI0021B6ABE8|nr:serine/threonine-protein kinase [Pseudomonas citri]